ncbi:helix-turn-helix domain-containing protein [Thiosulfativibrio zosterae]|uniref:Putative Fis-like DNA-binding protein n=1 Tax=Thiosulfativibrio zosterae TaxID=2675053 RepID=A0A6F8PL75_9GAMM|nr:helix-turn-helix domain-containing protein [Thiosulfativibrio zosterae]BBP42863.1 Fis family transcriptional regulator [Thiosulfativibrio zosterae]
MNTLKELQENAEYQSLSQAVTLTLQTYFKSLEGEVPTDLHKLVIGQVEKPLIQFILEHTEQNQSQAAALLGINRNTLRKKIQQYHL